MTAPGRSAQRTLKRILGDETASETARRLSPRLPADAPLPPALPPPTDFSAQALGARQALLERLGLSTRELGPEGGPIAPETLAGNTENFVGVARVPIGVAGPLRINGTCAHGDFYVPLATTEGALVASYHRGAHVISESGGAAVICTTESVARAPVFVFETLAQAGLFLAWVLPRMESLQEAVAATSRHCELTDLKPSLIGREVYLLLEFTTGDAAGQNMVTFAAEAVAERLLESSPVKPCRWYVEANMSGDKKATVGTFAFARGKKVVAEVIVPQQVLKRLVHATPQQMTEYWQLSMLGAIQSGAIGMQGQYANALAALFIACGQDVACVSEASVGLTRMDVTGAGDLYVSVVLPNLIVGTVGGGTGLPTARACLELLGCYGEGRARKLAEIVAATVLGGEISITAALSSGTFSRAHAVYGRRQRKKAGERGRG